MISNTNYKTYLQIRHKIKLHEQAKIKKNENETYIVDNNY